MPGEDVRESTRVILGELPDLPHLPELPARGVGADLAGRGIAVLVDLHAEVQPSGWRVAAAAGRDERRAVRLLAEDLDTLEEVGQGWAGPLKVQVVGPWTLAALLELRHGDKALVDPGACRDLAASLAEGVRQHLGDLRRRLPGAHLLLQLDEPALPAALVGSVPTASGFGQLAAIEVDVAVAGLRAVLGAVPEDVFRIVHCCASDVPVDLLRRAGAEGISFDLTVVGPRCDDAFATAVEAGTALLAGVADAAGLGEGASAAADSVRPVRALWSRTGLSTDLMPGVVLTPTCGLAGAAPDQARRALEIVREGARRLAEDPEGELGG